MLLKIKKTLEDAGLLDFIKKNFPFQELKTINDLQESKKQPPIPRKVVPKLLEFEDQLELIKRNVELMKNGRAWQNNFHTNLEALRVHRKTIYGSESFPRGSRGHEEEQFLDDWIKLFEIELAKTWADRNLPTFKKFLRNNKQKLINIFGALSNLMPLSLSPLRKPLKTGSQLDDENYVQKDEQELGNDLYKELMSLERRSLLAVFANTIPLAAMLLVGHTANAAFIIFWLIVIPVAFITSLLFGGLSKEHRKIYKKLKTKAKTKKWFPHAPDWTPPEDDERF